MKKIEHRIVIVPVDPVELMEALNQEGQDGFELKCFIPNTGKKKVWTYAVLTKESND